MKMRPNHNSLLFLAGFHSPLEAGCDPSKVCGLQAENRGAAAIVQELPPPQHDSA